MTDINYRILIQTLAQAPSRMAVARDGFSGNVGCPTFGGMAKGDSCEILED